MPRSSGPNGHAEAFVRPEWSTITDVQRESSTHPYPRDQTKPEPWAQSFPSDHTGFEEKPHRARPTKQASYRINPAHPHAAEKPCNLKRART